MICFFKGLLKNEAIPEGEDVVATINVEALSEEEQEELRRELAKVNLIWNDNFLCNL